MALDAEQYQDLIVKELKGGDLLALNIEVLWDQFEQWALRPSLRYLYTKVAAIDMLLGNLDEAYTTPVEGDRSSRLSQRANILMMLRRTTLDKIQQAGGRSGSYVVGLLTTYAPVGPPLDPGISADANDPVFYGDPYHRDWPPVQEP